VIEQRPIRPSGHFRLELHLGGCLRLQLAAGE
jgi:hypothetical protein